MASTSGGVKMKKNIIYSRMKQPPLIKQLKGILSEYPDGGQILKELIQNAEDAGAREVKILHDNRRINHLAIEGSETTPLYTKFFKGPALCVYNDAVFTDDDWEGIQMIYSSVKEEDPMKVGRFGLGFKSVFHITDFPCVISGDRVLLIDPQQCTEKVNATLDLCALDDYTEEGLDAEAFWSALENTFGLCRNTLGEDGFRGTLFWFPLRENTSDLSETLYNETKVKNLFDSFKSEASNILLFLKNIEKISLHFRNTEEQMKAMLNIEIEDKDNTVKQTRNAFKERIEDKNSTPESADIHSVVQLVIHTSSVDTNKSQEWLVVNYFVRESASEGFRYLIQDKHLGYSPYVGVATPLDGISEEFEGHVFCFLPLPREGERLTGLPVHVNGFFALSQNRHHMKWETEEQEGTQIDDKSILWNKALIEEALPKAYELLILEAIKIAEQNSNDEAFVTAVYNAMPVRTNSPRKTHKRWMMLENKLYEILEKRNIAYATHTNEWIAINKAFFATFRTLPGIEIDTSVQEAITRCLHKVGLKYTKFPNPLFDTMQTHFPYIKDLTPGSLVNHLQQRNEYRELTCIEKIQILAYLLLEEGNVVNIKGLELLPLASDRWTVFSKGSDPVYLCTDAAVKMFPGLEDKIVMESSKLGVPLSENIGRICKSETYQIQRLNVDCAQTLFKQTLIHHVGSDTYVRLTKESSLTSQWLENVWHVLIEKNMVKHFKDIPLVPVLLQGSWADPHVIELVRLSDFMIVKESEGSVLADGLCSCLHAMKVKVLASLPGWVPFEFIQEFVYRPTKEGIVSLLGAVYRSTGDAAVSAFNTVSQVNSQIRESLNQFTTTLAYIDNDVVKLFRKLRLFRSVRIIDEEGQYTSVADVPRYISEDMNFPPGVEFPYICIKLRRSEDNLIKQLEAENISTESLVLSTIQNLLLHKKHDQISIFMNYFIEHFNLFETNTTICENAAQLPFLKVGTKLYKPSELFDPSSSSLKRLLLGESLFPESSRKYSNEEIRALRRLGLKGKDKIDASVMLQVASTLSIWSKDDQKSHDLSKKASEFMEILVHHPDLLDTICNGTTTLGNALMSLSCIPVVQNAPVDYPEGLPWFSKNVKICKPSEAKVVEWSLLVGATVPMVECASDKIVHMFEWKVAPKIHTVLQQLAFIRQHYNVKNKPDYMRAVQRIYKHLNQFKEEDSNLQNKVRNDAVIWTGFGFEIPGKVIITKWEQDLDLKPYFCNLPEEIRDMDDLFLHFGCHSEQNNDILLSVLQSIKLKYESSTESPESSVSRDSEIVLEILRVLASRRKEGSLEIDDSKMLMLVENQPSDKLCLQNVSHCIFDDDQDELDQDEEKNFYVVNENVAVSVAKDLGVKSVKRKTILGATEKFSFKWGQHESLTNRVSTLLKDGYKDGLSVPKELVQNADDAGATVIKFLYDERPNNDAKRKEKLLSSDLIECQGPALWVYNDSQFTESDLQNITKLNGATKADDQDKIGKFGLGFCSVYNLTDVPSFISGKDMVIFDPHMTYLEDAIQERETGLRVRLSKRHLIRRNIDQFKPYSAVFGCNLLDETFTDFSGTLFRLPLRTANQAAYSEICKEAYTKEEVSVLLNKLVENAGNILLFTQNVKALEIYFLSKDKTDPSQAKLLFSVDKKIGQFSHDKTTRHAQSILKRIPNILKNNEDFTEVQRVEITQTLYENSFLTTKFDATNSVETNWILSWALGKNESLILSKEISEKGAVPLSAVAVPMKDKYDTMPLMLQDAPNGFYREGHLFCFLPLPIRTSLPVHVNGCFSVTSDRRGLSGFTEDDKRKGDNYIWNQALMADALVHSYVQLLLFLSTLCSEGYSYHSLWPVGESDDIEVFKQSFYRTLILDKPKLFRGTKDWLSADEVVYLDPSVRCNTQIGDTAFEFLSSVPVRQGKKIVELPRHVLKSFQDCKCDSKSTFIDAMISEEELIIHFLSTLSSVFWQSESEKMNKVILYSLKCNSKRVFAKLQDTKCIPSQPNDVLCKPKELINPRSEIADMFDVADGRFPSKDGFNEAVVIAQLISLGMNDKYLPNEMLIQRCKSVEALLKVCGSCAQERCVKVLKYCGQWEVMQNLEADTDSINRLKYTLLIPVLPSPTSWEFSWRGDTLQEYISSAKCAIHQNEMEKCATFEKPVNMFRESFYKCIGSVSSFVHEKYLCKTYPVPERLFKALDVKHHLTIDLLLEQLTHLSDQYTGLEQQCSNLDAISKSVYEELARLTGDKTEEEISKMQCFLNLREKPLIVIGKELVMPCKIAFKVKAECPPELYCLREVAYNRRKVFKALGVAEHFSVGYLISILKRLSTSWYQRVCTDIEMVTCLLQNLCESMKVENITYEDLKDSEVSIVAPDSDGFLRPTNELVIEDPAYKTSATLYILHGNISPDTGRALGVKSKQRRIVECFSSGFFMPFGQNESLVTRLTGILEDYPCDSSIMEELIQNADDAGATEIHFIKSYATHSSTKIFGRQELQGPALCVFNNSYFTEEDFNGIRNLGIGSKREDPSKTGQYGIGFNAVYHLTDVPSFLTKGPGLGNCGQMCIFDPLMTHLEGHITRENPGIKCDVEQMEESFPDMLHGYPALSLMEQAGQGTMFRLPLRQSRSDISKNIVSVKEMDKLLEECKHDMFESLLFLKNVKCIKVSSFSNGELKEEFAVDTYLSEEDALSRKKFFSDIKEVVDTNINSRQKNFSVQPVECTYRLTVKDSSGRIEKWLIVNRFGIEHVDEKYEYLMSAFKDKTLGLLPVASVALHLPHKEWKECGVNEGKEEYGGFPSQKARKAFCFLPLPVETGLPLHVNGHFALDKPRSKLWNEGIRKCWNEFVIAELITRAWISAIQFLKSYLLQEHPWKMKNRTICSAILETFHKHFPLWSTAVDDFWKCLVSNFYRIVIENKTTIFPSSHISLVNVSGTTEQRQATEEPNIRWVSLSVSANDYSGTFNGIKKETSNPHNLYHLFGRGDGIAVENTLKKMGMKIIETPINIFHSIEQSKIEYVPTCSPSSVLTFLKTFGEVDANSCQLGGIDTPLSETAIYDVGALESIIRFIRLDGNYKEQLNGLPLCVTNDGKLRTFKKDQPVYCSRMCEVLTGSAGQFIHSKCVFLIDKEEFYSAGVTKRFEIDDFVSSIAETFDRKTLANGNHIVWDKENGEPLKPQTVQSIYEFIYNKSLDCKSCITVVNQSLFQTNVQKFNDWALLPSFHMYGSQITHELVPISQTCHLLYKGFGIGNVYQILSKFNIPTLDTLLFSESARFLISPLQKMLPSTERPLELLECLLHYKSRLQSTSLTHEEGLAVLSYFDDNIDAMKQRTEVNGLRLKLKQLPLFVAHQGDLTSIENYQNVVVLPNGIPFDGIDVWAEKTGILLLTKTDKLLNLYEFLQFPRMSELDVYVDKILPSLHCMPREKWMSHITFIKNCVLTSSFNKDLKGKQHKMVKQLQNIAFVNVSGNNRRVNELYDCYNPVFAVMLTTDHFLPEVYRDVSWSHFMDLLGLVKVLTDEMLIKFALEIERNRGGPILDLTKKQSDTLAECLFNGSWEAHTLHRIKGIRFLVPHTVNSERRNVWKQPGNGEALVCFSESVFNENEDYCWSNLNLIPYVPLSEDIWKALGIYEFPPIEKIVQHCQNICDVLKSQLSRNRVKTSFVKFLMEKLYRGLKKYYYPAMQQSFQITPIIFHPEDETMLPVKEIVVNLTEEEEVKPYLYKLPICFGAYEDLFIKLGSHTHVTCLHYSNVLESIKQHYRDGPVPPNAAVCVRKALENIVRLLDKESQPFINVRKLYILDRKQCLVDSRKLTVANNIDIEERITGKLELNFFIGFRELDIKTVSDPEVPFLLCPQHLRPDILTDVVMEEVSTDDIEQEESVMAQRIENFLRSPNFVEGILRLVKHQMKLHSNRFETETEKIFMLRLTNVRITKVSGLKTFLKYKGDVVDGTYRETSCFIKSRMISHPSGNEIIENELLFQADVAEDILINLIEEQSGLVKLIDLCTDGILGKELSQHLASILRMQDNSSQIRQKLDKLRIAAYDLPASFAVSIFPRAGTYVEERFHPFLEQSIAPFKVHEFMYVALEVENDDDTGELVYIYAHIIRENRRRQGDSILQITYCIDAGCHNDECITVPLHRLYKFKPQQPEIVNALVVYDIEPIGSIPIDENFRRVRQMLIEAWSMNEKDRNRVIRRLLYRWHPDRNMEHQEYAERLFNYVKEVIIKLENNEIIDDAITHETGRMQPDMSRSSFGSASSAAYRTGCRYAAAFHDNMQDYNRSTRTGNYVHYKAEEAVVRHVGEAKRWHRQAVQDYIAAESNISTGLQDRSFNWVCYKCHQASEKALKAAWFAKNANRATKREHSLTTIANGLDDGSVLNEAISLEGITGNYSCMRYPDALAGIHHIPSEMFDRTKAERAIEVTKRILDMAADLIN